MQAQVGWYQGGLAVEMPDGGGTGVSVQHEFSGLTGQIQSVAVRLDVAGSWTGDLYAYLNFGGEHAILLNRPGMTTANTLGYGDAGLQVRLRDDAPNGDIHCYRLTLFGDPGQGVSGPLTGDWAPDGRITDPAEVTFTDDRSALLSAFVGSIPNGTWTLFLADMASGSVHQLNGWGLEFELIPEPASAVVITGTGCILWAFGTRLMERGRKSSRV